MTTISFSNFRKNLHQFPELSNQEASTAQRVLDQFTQFPPDEIYPHLGGTGIAFIYNGEMPGPTSLLRCELDAVPVQEANIFAHRSVHDGISHKCGHDGHMAIITAVGKKLAQNKPQKGRVVLLFQPAEEIGAGALAVVEDKNFKQINADFAFALHNIPGQPLGEVFVKPGSFNCASRGMSIQLVGKASHAAHPDNGVSPALAMSEIIQLLPKITERIDEFCLVTLVGATLGTLDAKGNTAFGTSPGEASIMATLRTSSNTSMESMVKYASNIATQRATEFGLSVKFEWSDIFHACSNTQAGYEHVSAACRELNIPCTTLTEAYRWSEDFGKLLDASKEGAMFTLGAGIDSPQLHNPDYDFPDSLISVGRDIFLQIIRGINGIK